MAMHGEPVKIPGPDMDLWNQTKSDATASHLNRQFQAKTLNLSAISHLANKEWTYLVDGAYVLSMHAIIADQS